MKSHRLVRPRFGFGSVWLVFEPRRGQRAANTSGLPDVARLGVGDFPHLKNFRKGLQHQRWRCAREIKEAEDRQDAATAEELKERLEWIHLKQHFLDHDNVMVWDQPCVIGGKER